MKIVFDTNVLLAGVFTHGVCEALLDACIDDTTHQYFISQYILNEFAEHAGKFAAPPADIEEVCAFLRSHFQLVVPVPVDRRACRDADDLPVLGTALAAQADFLVSGDKDLLILKQFESAAIVSARELYEKLWRPGPR